MRSITTSFVVAIAARSVGVPVVIIVVVAVAIAMVVFGMVAVAGMMVAVLMA
jgi:hypothetical protein